MILCSLWKELLLQKAYLIPYVLQGKQQSNGLFQVDLITENLKF